MKLICSQAVDFIRRDIPKSFARSVIALVIICAIATACRNI